MKWPGYHADGEDQRKREEWQREQAIRARNLSARIQAADPVARNRIDRATGRTYADGSARGFYDDARVLGDFRAMTDRFRRDRERYRWAQARMQGRAGRN